MMIRPRSAILLWAVTIACSGCSGSGRLLGFTTATTFGLDISLRADDNINVTMGYDRAEIASVPVEDKTDASEPDKTDAYSVLGYFSVSYGNPFSLKPEDNLKITQLFATGVAAREASKPNMGTSNALQAFLGEQAGTIAEKGVAK